MKKSKLAIASFILSLLPIIIPILILGAVVIDDAFNPSTGQVFSYVFFLTFGFAILAVILGIIALVKIKKNNFGGKWFAITGIFISVILLTITNYLFSTSINLN